MKLKRREFLNLLGWSMGAAMLPLSLSSCSKDMPDVPWELLERLLEALNESPDNLIARSKDIVKVDDPQKIFEFVRDEFLTLPTPLFWGGKYERWGVRGLLRSGMGTSREKAELLNALYQDAGYESSIYYGTYDYEENGGMSAFLPHIPPEFEPTLSVNTIESWMNKLNLGGDEVTGKFDFKDYDIEAWTNKLHGLTYEPSKKYLEHDWKAKFKWMYFVKVKIGEEQIFVNPSLSKSEFGKHYSKNPKEGKQEAFKGPKVNIAIEAAYDDSPYLPRPLVVAEWSASELMGRQVELNFAALGEANEVIQKPANEIKNFAPILQLKGFDLTQEELEKSLIEGDAISLDGKVTKKEYAERVLNDPDFSSSISSKPGDTSQIESIKLIKNKSADFPKIYFYAQILDGAGKMVYGLTPPSFTLKENGKEIHIRVLENQPYPPRVIFVFDSSGSMPYPYQSLSKTKQILQELVKAVQAKSPKTEFKIAGLGSQKAPLHNPSPWLTDLEKMLAYLPLCKSRSSNNWSALLGGVSSEADLAVLITDADGGEKFNPYYEQKIKEGVPAIIFGVESSFTKKGGFEKMAEVSNGKMFLIEKQEAEAVGEVTQQIVNIGKDKPYLFSFDSPHEELEVNDVIFSIKDKPLDVEFSYTVPVLENRKPKGTDAITGLYLRIKIGNEEIHKTIAGVMPDKNSRSFPIEQVHLDHVKSSLFGRYTLTFEGGPPTQSHLLSDFIRSKLSMRPLYEAMETDDLQKMLSAVQASEYVKLADRHLPLSFPLGLPQEQDSLTYPDGYQVVFHSIQPNRSFDYELKSDILPFFKWNTIGPDPEESFKRTLSHSLKYSAMEAANFSKSAPQILKDQEVQLIKSTSLKWVNKKNMEQEYLKRWAEIGSNFRFNNNRYFALVPKDGKHEAYWHVDRNTGTALGMLPDGSGGAAQSAGKKFDQIAVVISLYEQVFAKLAPSLGVWAKLEKTKLEYLKLATIAIIKMDGSVTMDDVKNLAKKQLEDYIKGKLKGAAKKMFPSLGGPLKLEKWIKIIIKAGSAFGD